ncbi:hypothetical protein C8F01DRAFT_146261 [Mycena amicta]|nr:hypothetical protein C8F01DRAFT_146261 [Mycena amicta]
MHLLLLLALLRPLFNARHYLLFSTSPCFSFPFPFAQLLFWGFRSLLIRPPASLWLLVAALHFGVLGLIFSLPKARGRLVYRSWHSLVPELAPLDAPFRGVSVVPSWSTEPSVLVRDVNAHLASRVSFPSHT